MRTYFLNPHIGGGEKYIREGRCMQKASSWVSVWPPTGLATLASITRRRGEVRLLDGNVEAMGREELLKDVRRFAPHLLVLSTGFPSIDDDMATARMIKEACPGIRVLVFGVYFTLLGEAGFREYPHLDLAIVGEPEETFDEIMETICTGEDRYD
jgi:anaerobic magnesium-protoporphyrin IX monomethyl ester cyclase